MERFAQYWDDLDDLIGMVGLCAEHIRRLAIFFVSTALFALVVVASVLLALAKPPLALAVATILLVQLAYHTVTGTPANTNAV